MSKEPAAIVGTITALVSALLVFAKAFGVNLTDDQQEAIRGLVAVVAPLIAAFVIRALVVSPEAAGEAVANAKRQDPMTKTVPEIKVQGFKEAAAKHLNESPAMIDWHPPVEAH